MSINRDFKVKYSQSPRGIEGDFIGKGKRIHFFVDKEDGVILTASPDTIRGEVMGEIYEYIQEEIVRRA